MCLPSSSARRSMMNKRRTFTNRQLESEDEVRAPHGRMPRESRNTFTASLLSRP